MKLRMKVKKRDMFFRKIEAEIEIEADTKEDIIHLIENAKMHVE